MAHLLLIMVNYRTAQLAADCLDSLAVEVADNDDLRVEILDGASGDGSVDALREHIERRGYASWCTLTALDRNGGFAFANNCSIRRALASANSPEFFLLLNPDTLVQPGALQTLVQFLSAHPKVGMAGSRLQDLDGTLQTSAFNFPSVLQELSYSARLRVLTLLLWRWRVAPPHRSEAHRCDWVAGACMLVRREVFEQIGLLDDGYFMYYEEVDFCLRAARAGWECWYVPEARVFHLAGQSSGVTDTRCSPRRLPPYWFESRRRYFEKNHGRTYRIIADAAWTFGQALYLVYRLIRGRPREAPPFLVRDFLSHSLGRKTVP